MGVSQDEQQREREHTHTHIEWVRFVDIICIWLTYSLSSFFLWPLSFYYIFLPLLFSAADRWTDMWRTVAEFKSICRRQFPSQTPEKPSHSHITHTLTQGRGHNQKHEWRRNVTTYSHCIFSPLMFSLSSLFYLFSLCTQDRLTGEGDQTHGRWKCKGQHKNCTIHMYRWEWLHEQGLFLIILSWLTFLPCVSLSFFPLDFSSPSPLRFIASLYVSSVMISLSPLMSSLSVMYSALFSGFAVSRQLQWRIWRRHRRSCKQGEGRNCYRETHKQTRGHTHNIHNIITHTAGTAQLAQLYLYIFFPHSFNSAHHSFFLALSHHINSADWHQWALSLIHHHERISIQLSATSTTATTRLCHISAVSCSVSQARLSLDCVIVVHFITYSHTSSCTLSASLIIYFHPRSY